MSADTISIFFFFFAIFLKLAKSEPYLAILLFYDGNLTATANSKLPTFCSFKKIVSLVKGRLTFEDISQTEDFRKTWYKLMCTMKYISHFR